MVFTAINMHKILPMQKPSSCNTQIIYLSLTDIYNMSNAKPPTMIYRAHDTVCHSYVRQATYLNLLYVKLVYGPYLFLLLKVS